MNYFLQMVLLFPPILAALTVHEYSHGMIAYRLGDPTAKDAGRLTLNPFAHLDLVGTIMLFIVHFGWAKPVPVNPYYFKNPRRDMIWVALAGPGANVVLAWVVGLAMQLIYTQAFPAMVSVSFLNYIYTLLAFTVYINLMLAMFNLIPIPPLDGSKIVAGLIPQEYVGMWYRFERLGGLLLLGLVLYGMFTRTPIFSFISIPSEWFYAIFTGGLPTPF